LVQFELIDAVNILNRTPRILNAQLRGLDDRWVDMDGEVDTLSPRQTVEHMIETEENVWIPSLATILDPSQSSRSDGESDSSQNAGAMNKLLDQFGMVRRKNLRLLAEWRLTDEHLGKQGFLADSGEISLRQLLSSWVTHDLSHLSQIAQFLTKPFSGEIGTHRICAYYITER